MNLAEAFAVLAQTGCRLKAEAGGGIVLDVPPGGPAVPSSVLQALAAHRDSLVAVLSPATPMNAPAGQADTSRTPTRSSRPSPYARDLGVALARKPTPKDEPITVTKIVAMAKAARRAKQANAEQTASPKANPDASTSPPSFSAPCDDDGIPF